MSARLLLTVVSALIIGLVWQGDSLAQDKRTGDSGGRVTSSPSVSKSAPTSSTRSRSTGTTLKKKIPTGGGTASPGAAQKQSPSAGDRQT